MPITNTDAFEATLNEIQEKISTSQVGDGDEVLNILEEIVNAMGQLNMRLHRIESKSVLSP